MMASNAKTSFVVVISLILRIVHSRLDEDPDVELKTPDLVKKYGYPVEIHNVVTADGYILEVHRIPTNPNFKLHSRGIPVVILHGLAGSSADWVIMGPGKSLAYLMADQGYDVWLGNNRGNIYSRNHTSMSPNDKCFWDFSFHELGVYDLPAMIDYVIEITGNSRIFYVGHSQGSTQFFVMTSTFPEYNSKIILMGGLAPAAYTSNLRGPVTKLAELTYFGVWVGEKFGYPEFGPRSNWGKFLASLLCNNETFTQILCKNIFFLISGFNEEDLNMAKFAVIIGHIPAGASWKQFIHYGQGFIKPGYFRHFDYANIKINFEIYNASEPPEYNLEGVTTPVALFSSDNDWLATSEDINMLRKKLPNIVLDHELSMNSFNHYDFIWGCRAPHLVFDTLLNLMAKYL